MTNTHTFAQEQPNVFKKVFFDSCAAITELFPQPDGCIWLKNIRINAYQPTNPMVSELVLEVAIDRISTFVLGHLI